MDSPYHPDPVRLQEEDTSLALNCRGTNRPHEKED